MGRQLHSKRQWQVGTGDDDWRPTAPEPAGDLGADDVANAVDYCSGTGKGKSKQLIFSFGDSSQMQGVPLRMRTDVSGVL